MKIKIIYEFLDDNYNRLESHDYTIDCYCSIEGNKLIPINQILGKTIIEYDMMVGVYNLCKPDDLIQRLECLKALSFLEEKISLCLKGGKDKIEREIKHYEDYLEKQRLSKE